MRVIGFAKKWPKLQKPVHTTFRFPRKDSDRGQDWHEGEIVQEVYHARSNVDREILGVAEIIGKEPKRVCEITWDEAIEDGFPNGNIEMFEWLMKSHRLNATAIKDKMINKLTLWKVNG